MNTLNDTINPTRALCIDFSLFGEDQDSKLELVDLLIENVRELQQAARSMAHQNDSDIFVRVCHKVKTAIHLLQDFELRILIDDLKAGKITPRNMLLFENITTQFVISLIRLRKAMTIQTR